MELTPLLFIVCLVGFLVILFVIISLAILVPTLGIIGGIGWFFNKQYKDARALRIAAQNWSSTTGKVITSRVEVTGGDHTTVSPHIVYQYNVYSNEYSNSQIKVGDTFISSYTSRQSYDTVDKYPVGAEVTVYYDPENPQQSALER